MLERGVWGHLVDVVDEHVGLDLERVAVGHPTLPEEDHREVQSGRGQKNAVKEVWGMGRISPAKKSTNSDRREFRA